MIPALAEDTWRIDGREPVIFITEPSTARDRARRLRPPGASTILAALADETPRTRPHRELGRDVDSYAPPTELVVLDELEYLAPHDRDNEPFSQIISERNERQSLICTINPPDSASRPTRSPTKPAKRSSTRIATEAHTIDNGSESWRVRHGLDGGNQQRKHHGPGVRVLPTSTAITPRQPRTTNDANRGQFKPSLRTASTSHSSAPGKQPTRA